LPDSFFLSFLRSAFQSSLCYVTPSRSSLQLQVFPHGGQGVGQLLSGSTLARVCWCPGAFLLLVLVPVKLSALVPADRVLDADFFASVFVLCRQSFPEAFFLQSLGFCRRRISSSHSRSQSMLSGVGSSHSKLAFLSAGADACRVSSAAHLECSWSWLPPKPSSSLVPPDLIFCFGSRTWILQPGFRLDSSGVFGPLEMAA
jgi:hypothetical protein